MKIKNLPNTAAAAGLYLLSCLPFSVLYLLADGIFLLLYYGLKYRRRVVEENLIKSFPQKTTAEIQCIERKFYRHLADLMVESIKMFTISKAEVERRVRINNPQVLQESLESGQSVIGTIGHYGNWELNALRLSLLTSNPRIIVYKPLSNAFFNKAILKMRSRFGATLVSMKSIGRVLAKYRHQPTVTMLVGDQTPAKCEVQYFTRFLQQPTAVFLGVEKLAKATNSKVIFCDVRRLKRGYYECTFVPLFDEPQATAVYEITNAHVHYLEQIIEQQPEYWLWSHRRWKYHPEEFDSTVVNPA